MNGWDVFNGCDGFGRDNPVDDEVTNVAAWAVASSNLLMDGELLLVNGGIARPLN